MKTLPPHSRLSALILTALLALLLAPTVARAVTIVFFDSSQRTNLVGSGTTSDTLSSEGYLFTFTRDKLFTGGVGLTNPIGRTVRVPWPDGLEAQAVTTGPVRSGAKIVIAREDGQPFAIESFTAKLLANTAGAGGSWEIMPKLHGEDGVPDPFMYEASGYYGMNFTYNTPELTGFEAYIMTLYVDYAVMSLTVMDASPPPPFLDMVPISSTTLQLSWPTNAVGYALVSATNLPPTVWAPVTNSVATNADGFSVQLPVSGSQRYFQLRK